MVTTLTSSIIYLPALLSCLYPAGNNLFIEQCANGVVVVVYVVIDVCCCAVPVVVLL